MKKWFFISLLVLCIGAIEFTNASVRPKPKYHNGVDISTYHKDWTKKKRGDFDTDFTAYVNAARTALNTKIAGGDTVVAYKNLEDAISVLDKYDVPTEYKATYPSPGCVYGCALWVLDCLHPYPGVEAAGGCLLSYQHCLNHCGYNYPY